MAICSYFGNSFTLFREKLPVSDKIEEFGEHDKTSEDDKAVDNKVEECVWVPEELKSVAGYQGTLVSLRLSRTGVSLLLPRYSGQPEFLIERCF